MASRTATVQAADRAPGQAFADLLPYLLLVPSVLMLLAVTLYPLLYAARLSLFSFRFGKELNFIWLANYSQLLRDENFHSTLLITVAYTFFSVSIEFLLGLGLALLLSSELRFRGLFRTALMVPMIVTPVVVGIVWRMIYASDIGVLNYVVKALTGQGYNILAEPTLALPAVIAMDIWEWTPFMFLVLLAGLQSLPQEPFEAARVDGASAWQTFRDLTLPMLRPVILVALLIRTMDAFTVFDQIFVLTNGGPGTATEVASLAVYRAAFKYQLWGSASAMVFFVFLIILIVSLVYLWFMREPEAAR